ncbi:MAG: hypothetical protein ACI4B5_09425 [Bacteroidaceae bacterium]
MMDKYAHIIDLPHHVSKARPQMSMYQRAAQFAPFAALTGHSAAINETARLTDKRIELSESEYEMLNQKITLLLAHLNEHPYVSITYFIPDLHKEGGQYTTHAGTISSWDEYEQRITFDDNTQIKAYEIIDIKGKLFDSRTF